MAKQAAPIDDDNAGECFAVSGSTPGDYYVADPAAPLAHGCHVTVRIDLDGNNTYVEGKVLTKRPDRAKSIAVRLNNRGHVWRARKDDVARVIGEYRRKPYMPKEW